MSDTPRTDKAYEYACGDVDREIQDGWDLAKELELEVSRLKAAIREADECSTANEGVGLLYWMDGCQINDDDPSWITISDTLHNPL